MRKFLKYVLTLSFLFMLCSCGLNYKTETKDGKTVYNIENKKYIESDKETNLIKIDVKDKGIIVAELYPDIAPITVENLKKLVNDKFYDGLIFHRIIKDFMIQTGDPLGTGIGGSDENIKGEFVVVVSGFENTFADECGIVEQIQFYIDNGMQKMEAIKIVAREREMKKNEVYALYHQEVEK